MSASTGWLNSGCVPFGEIAKDLRNRRFRRRANCQVRRNSVLRDDVKDFYRAITSQDARVIRKGAKSFEQRTKEKGKKNGKLGYTGLRVLEALLDIVDHRSGRLEPSYLWLKKKTGLCVSAIADALKRLSSCGFLEIMRRYEATNNASGPQVRQITNAYRFSLPMWLRAAVDNKQPPPMADDEAVRLEDARAERERMICQLPVWQQGTTRADVVDLELKRRLDAISILLPDVRGNIERS